MMMMEKNRLGVNMMVFVFLLSLLAPCASFQNEIESDADFSTIQKIEERVDTYSATAVDVSGVSYKPLKVDPLNYKKLVMELTNKINIASVQGQKFYIGVAKKPDGAIKTIQALCARQGKPNDKLVPATATSCGRESTHHRDIASKECGFKLTEVFYADAFLSKTLVCGTEKELIATYYNNCKVDSLCLNRQVGNDDCIKATEGIVYLRIYK